MRFQGAILAVACVGALLACAADATQLKASADQRALLRTSLAVAEEKIGFKKTVKATGDGASKAGGAAVDGVAEAGETIGAPIAQAVAAVNSYVDNQLVSDLTAAGNTIKNQLANLVCDNTGGIFAVTVSCSLALAAAVCAATEGAAPGCVDKSLELYEKLAIAIGLAAVAVIFRCTYFHILRQIPGLCEGRAYGIATHVANAVVADPYTSVCTLTIGCSCGPSSCTFECANDPSVCYGSTYTDAFKAMLNLIE